MTPRTSPEPIPEEELRFLSSTIASRLQSPALAAPPDADADDDMDAMDAHPTTPGAPPEIDLALSHHGSDTPTEGCKYSRSMRAVETDSPSHALCLQRRSQVPYRPH